MNYLDNKELLVEIADVCALIKSNRLDLIDLFEKRYYDFLSKKNPDMVVKVRIGDRIMPKNSGYDLTEGKDLTREAIFSFIEGEKELIIDLEKKYGIILLKNDELEANFIISDAFLRICFAILISAESNGVLLHASTLLRKAKGYVFMGNCNSGKTTVARLSTDSVVLNDETAVIRKVHNSYLTFGSPFWGELSEKSNSCGEIEGIFLLKPDTEVYCRRLKTTEAVVKLVSQVILSATPLLFRLTGMPQRILDICTDMACKIPCYELHFLPNNSFWRCIDNISYNPFREIKGGMNNDRG